MQVSYNSLAGSVGEVIISQAWFAEHPVEIIHVGKSDV